MTDYGKMSVHDLLGEARNYEFMWSVESALRRAVIREAQVGEISIEQHEGYMSPDPMFTVGSKSKLKAGEFYLVPKEEK